MINFQMFGLYNLLSGMQDQERHRASLIKIIESQCVNGDNIANTINDDDRRNALDMIAFADDLGRRLGFQSVCDRAEIFKRKLQNAIFHHDFLYEIRALREAFESNMNYKCFYAYPDDKAALLRNIEEEMGGVFSKMPEVKSDMISSVDCYAVGHNLACVFYLMRVMEVSVHRFGKKMKIDLIKMHPGRRVSELSWEQILNDITPVIKKMPQGTLSQKRKYERHAALQSYLYGVKDAWRNPTMHPRAVGYNELQARDILNHVKSFLVNFSKIL